MATLRCRRRATRFEDVCAPDDRAEELEAREGLKSEDRRAVGGHRDDAGERGDPQDERDEALRERVLVNSMPQHEEGHADAELTRLEEADLAERSRLVRNEGGELEGSEDDARRSEEAV